ncbi:MAG: hypothetical protein U0360_07085 [Dehalococcoidia bacterium]
MWGRAAECGILEDPWVEPPEDAYERDALARPDARPAGLPRGSRSSTACRSPSMARRWRPWTS